MLLLWDATRTDAVAPGELNRLCVAAESEYIAYVYVSMYGDSWNIEYAGRVANPSTREGLIVMSYEPEGEE